MKIRKITGGFTAAKGFKAASCEAAIKYQNRRDMALLFTDVPCAVAGTFTMVWDICYPLKHQFAGLDIMLFPGDTVRFDFDRAAFQAYTDYQKNTPGDSITTQRLRELLYKAVASASPNERYQTRLRQGVCHGPPPRHLRRVARGVLARVSECSAAAGLTRPPGQGKGIPQNAHRAGLSA